MVNSKQISKFQKHLLNCSLIFYNQCITNIQVVNEPKLSKQIGEMNQSREIQNPRKVTKFVNKIGNLRNTLNLDLKPQKPTNQASSRQNSKEIRMEKEKEKLRHRTALRNKVVGLKKKFDFSRIEVGIRWKLILKTTI